jgi:hypothetical protein
MGFTEGRTFMLSHHSRAGLSIERPSTGRKARLQAKFGYLRTHERGPSGSHRMIVPETVGWRLQGSGIVALLDSWRSNDQNG